MALKRKRRPHGPARTAGFVTIDVDGDALANKLDKEIKLFFEKRMRGVVAVAANEFRDQARSNAVQVGLAEVGTVTYASGKTYTRHGGIPQSIFAYTAPNEGDTVKAVVGFDHLAAGYDNWYAVLIENGTRFVPARPFFRRAVNETMGSAVGEAKKKFSQAFKETFG
jgi:HK97 gp10 family phage protein